MEELSSFNPNAQFNLSKLESVWGNLERNSWITKLGLCYFIHRGQVKIMSTK